MPAQLSFNQAQKSIRKAAKRVLTEKGLKPNTRKGNKEFDFLLQQLRAASFSSHQAAIAVGEQLGEKIADLSQQAGKQNLDRGVVRQLAMQTDWISELGLSVASAVSASTPPAVIDSPTTAAPANTPTQAAQSATTSPANVTDTAEVTPAAAATEVPAAIETAETEAAVTETATNQEAEEMDTEAEPPAATAAAEPTTAPIETAVAEEATTTETVVADDGAAAPEPVAAPDTDEVASEPVA